MASRSVLQGVTGPMAVSGTSWQPGESGNPNGRPPKSRALTEILEKKFNKTYDVIQPDGTTKRRSGKHIIAEMLVNIAVFGKTTTPEGGVIHIDGFSDWQAVVKFIYQHVDGPPRLDVDVTSAGEKLAGPTIYLPQVEEDGE
jgi:hypothetical protein